MKPHLSEDPVHGHGAWKPRTRGEIPWRYSLAEIRADGAVHGVGLTLAALALAGFAAMPRVGGGEALAVAVYLATLVTSLVVSALYNLWPVSQLKWRLRRLDHSAIYLLIAGTYTPFMVLLQTWWLLGLVWGVAAIGIALKLFCAGRFDALSIVLYLALGWSGLTVCTNLADTFSATTLWLIGIGGLVYTAGIAFHLCERLPFQNAVWHGFVVAGAMLHYGAVWSAVTASA